MATAGQPLPGYVYGRDRGLSRRIILPARLDRWIIMRGSYWYCYKLCNIYIYKPRDNY